jgi:type I restriction enzyme M protein
MLDADTKRRIDSCRDILVGKVPDPKSQVEQITIALIYKFMDDMDAQSEEFGGKRSFFINGFEKYGWSKLLAPSMGGQDTLNLYSEAIGKMTENTHLPPLFREIFKNAYLPYRDPETLKAFLKEIAGFSYDHSERLGDAFEYLLSVLGSQGDAGQFRTPRHIIDFIVQVINPQKHERILDPACGTAGFLISAWKHILSQNQQHKPGDRLTPDERNKLAANIHGYDISPDMVRLSLVNLYLHGFTHPHVDEYDTLTSEDKWNEHADVILANPPFMSPKGGIKPHKRFSIQAKRSEVLFVDYIHEHLSPNGRAGIIVPEGIIFQSGTAYKALRKLLVQNSLVAVVSLPAGVFQPYSGVKTSVLILDKRLTKQTDQVLFIKVSSDGFALGAQRKRVSQNDLPKAAQALKTFFDNPSDFKGDDFSQLVTRKAIGENTEWNLSGDRFLASTAAHYSIKTVELGDICKPAYGYTASAEESGDTRFVRITDINEFGRLRTDGQKFISLSSESKPYLLEKGDLLVARTGATFGKTMLFDEDYPAVFASYLIRLRFPKDLLLPEFYWAFSQTERYWAQARNLVTGGGQPQFNGNTISKIRVPIPSIEIQREIVSEVENHQRQIDKLKQDIASREQAIRSSMDKVWAG